MCILLLLENVLTLHLASPITHCRIPNKISKPQLQCLYHTQITCHAEISYVRRYIAKSSKHPCCSGLVIVIYHFQCCSVWVLREVGCTHATDSHIHLKPLKELNMIFNTHRIFLHTLAGLGIKYKLDSNRATKKIKTA